MTAKKKYFHNKTLKDELDIFYISIYPNPKLASV